MTPGSLCGKAAIAGVGETPMGRLPGYSAMALHALAAKHALSDAGLAKDDIDGVLTVGSLVDRYPHHSGALCEYLGIRPAYTDTVMQGGAGSCTMVQYAAMLVSSGVCRAVLCAGADNQLTGMTRDMAVEAFARNREPQYEYPFGLSTPAGYALIAQRHFSEYGTTREQLARIAVAARRHAGLHPNAQEKRPLTVDEALAAKPISAPLHLPDCCLSSDGGGAVIVVAADRARDLPSPRVVLLGAGQGFYYEHICHAGDVTATAARSAGAAAYAMAGVQPADVDFAQLYDCFTITVLLQLEDYGFCGKGEGGRFIEERGIGLGGQLPVNTHGGLLAYGNPGLCGGLFHVIEAVRQLRGACGARQVPDARVGLVTGVGAVLSHCSALVLARD